MAATFNAISLVNTTPADGGNPFHNKRGADGS